MGLGLHTCYGLERGLEWKFGYSLKITSELKVY